MGNNYSNKTHTKHILDSPFLVTLSDNTTFKGYCPNWVSKKTVGEIVFNTGMTGYVESLTDPSYYNQILVFTYPLIGNYGVDLTKLESDKIQVKGVIVCKLSSDNTHNTSKLSFIDWLKKQKIPVIYDVDTRALTKHLRTKGTMIGAISNKKVNTANLTLPPSFVSIKKFKTYNAKGNKKVILVDCGLKKNILRSLINLNLRVKRVPYNYDYTKESFDGVVISNGPGDPVDYKDTIKIATKVMKYNKPVFGICLGNQIMALASKAKTYKLKFGHRGHNQPCMCLENQKCYITSQNHGYSVKENTLTKNWSVTYKNLNDNSVEGIEHKTKPFFSVQFHPEACPGPTDTKFLFDKFYKCL